MLRLTPKIAKQRKTKFDRIDSGADPIKLFFGVKLSHITINYFFLYVTNVKAYQQKMEKIFASDKKSFIGSAKGQYRQNISEYLK